MKTILVTGGCGFIGGHFVRRLYRETDWRVINLDKLTYAASGDNLLGVGDASRYRFMRGDTADDESLERLFQEEKPQLVVNFAAESHVDRSILNPLPFLRTNVMGVQVVLEASRRYRVERFLHISTDEVYGDIDGKQPSCEESPLRPSSPYAATKAAADLLCMAYHRTYGVPILIVRSSNNFGPYQFPEKVIPLMIRNMLSGRDLPVYGDGLQRRDWLYVEDNCSAIFLVLERGNAGSVFNVGTGEEHTNLELVQTLCRLLAQETGTHPGELLKRIRFVPDRPGHDRCYIMSTAKVRRELGWAARIPFAEGLKQTVQWYVANRAWVERIGNEDYQTYYDAVYRHVWGRI